MSLSITNNRTTYSQAVKSAEVHSEEEKGHHGKAHSTSTAGGRVLTAPKSVHSTGHRSKVSAHVDSASGGTGSTTTTPATPAPVMTIDELLVSLGHSDIIKKVKTMEAKHQLLVALEDLDTASTDTGKIAAVKKVLTDNKEVLVGTETDLITEADHTALIGDTSNTFSTLNRTNLFGGKTAADYKTDILDVETTKLTPIKTNAQKILDRLSREHFDKAGIENIAKTHGKGLSWGGWAGVAGLAAAAGIGSWFMGNNAVKAAEEKAKAAEDKVAALEQGTQDLFRQFIGQVVQPMQAEASSNTKRLTNLVMKLIQMEKKKGTASTPAHGSVASRAVRSDDNSAGSPTPPADDIAKLEKEVAEMEKQQASQPKAQKPATAPESPQGGETSHAGAMPQQLGMPQSGGESGMPQQPETQRIRFHRFPEDNTNGRVPVNAFLGDKVITRKVSNTGDRAIIERDDDC